MALTIFNNRGGGIERQSGIELLRLVAMFMVLLLHANYISFGSPSAEDVHNHLFSSFGRILAEQLCIVAVNVYVLISGWFGIKPKTSSFIGLLTQIFTYSFIILLGWIIYEKPKLHFYDLAEVLVIGKQYWFVVSYLLLYLISPILNSFATTTPKETYKKVLIAYFSFEFVYGWFAGDGGFSGGYSTLSFIGLYLLARYLRFYGEEVLNRKKRFYLCIYLFTSLAVAGWTVFQLYTFGVVFFFSYIDYNCPFVILASVMLFLAFLKLKFRNSIINYFSTSALSVYLIHVNPHLWGTYQSTVRKLYYTFEGVGGILYVLLMLLSFFFICLVVDKIRIRLTPTDKICSFTEKILRRFKIHS